MSPNSNPLQNRIPILGILLSVSILFQNCAEDVSIEKYDSTNQSSESTTDDNSPLPAAADANSNLLPQITRQLKLVAGPESTAIPEEGTVMLEDAFYLQIRAKNATHYQWYKDSQPIAGATSSNYIASATDTTPGAYSVEVSNRNGALQSQTFRLNIKRHAYQNPPISSVSPRTTTSIVSRCQIEPSTVRFSVATTNSSPSVRYKYRWFHNGHLIANENRSTLTVEVDPTAGPTVAGEYTVEVSNKYGVDTDLSDNSARLTVSTRVCNPKFVGGGSRFADRNMLK